MKTFSLLKLTEILSGELKGDPQTEVNHLADIRDAGSPIESGLHIKIFVKVLRKKHGL